jgi:hypothetical protein
MFAWELCAFISVASPVIALTRKQTGATVGVTSQQHQ